MTYIGVNPHTNIKRFTEVKPLSSYPEDALKEIKLLSFSRDKTAQPFGSYIYRIQKYPGDLDLVEEFTDCCSANDVITKFSKTLQRIVRKINKTRVHYFSEVKAGLDYRYDIDIGEMVDGNYFPNPELSKITANMFRKKLFTKEENNIIQYILSRVESLGANEYDTITFIFRERRILRWSDEEILKGIKQLPAGISITLKQALSHETHIKIDMITELNERLVEITNFFQLAYVTEENQELNIINLDLAINHNIPVQLPKEIEKLYFSDMFYSPFKMIKRMYSLARHNHDDDLLNKVIPFVSSNTSLLYQIKSEIDTIILIIERMKGYPKKLIEKELNDAKLRISTVLELSDEDLIQINNIIDEINTTTGKYDKRNKLKILKKLLVAYINMQTINYLQKVGLNPPPYRYLPAKHTYNVNHIRGPGENPINPFSEYENIIMNLGDVVLKSVSEVYGVGGVNVYYPVNHHFPNFFEDPKSSAILSQRIISNPGLNEVPAIDVLRRELIQERVQEDLKAQANAQILGNVLMKGEGGTKISAWWAAFVRHYYDDNNEYPPITYDAFKKLFAKRKKYNYNQMLNKIFDAIEFIPERAPVIKIPHIKYVPEEQISKQHLQEIQEKHPSVYEKEILQPYEMQESIHKDRFDRYFGDILSRCEGRTDKFIDHLLSMRESHPEEHIMSQKSNRPREVTVSTIEEIGEPSSRGPAPPPPPMLSPEEREEQRKRREEAQKNKPPPEMKGPRELMMEELMKKVASKQQSNIPIAPPPPPSQGNGRYGGYEYEYNCQIPLYMRENLPVYKLHQNEMHLHPQTASSYASDYDHRGYGPSLKGVHIINAPVVMHGQIVPGLQRAGCEDCGLKNFRRIH